MHIHTFEKKDFIPTYENHYLAKENEVIETDTHDFSYISISGKGHPETSNEFNKAVQLIEGLIFTIKFKLKTDPPE